jgi:pimeloyl-ACP methyl ester carboxylesterase
VGLAYERLGAGPPLVLLHGIGHRRQAWTAILGRITQYRDVVLVDLPGHGESPKLDTAGRSVAQALLEDTSQLLDQLGLDRPHLAGSSLGGRLALELAVVGRAASVTAFSPAGFWRTDRELSYARAVNKMMQVSGQLIRPFGSVLSRSTLGRALIYAEIVCRPSQVTAQQASGDMEAFLNSRSAMDAILAAAVPFSGYIPRAVPVTIAWGTRDRLLRPRQSIVAKQRLPQARLISLPGCGHVPMTDDPRLVADVLLDGSRATDRVDRPVDVGLSRPTVGGRVPGQRSRFARPPRSGLELRRAMRRPAAGASPLRQPSRPRPLRRLPLPAARSSSLADRHGSRRPASRGAAPPCATAGPG